MSGSSSDGEHDFACGDAEAAFGSPVRAGELKKGEFVLIQGHPCKIVDVAKSKSGKHGHSKVKVTGLDVFCATKHVAFWPSSHTAVAPEVTREEYVLISMSDDGFASLMHPETGALRSDLSLPPKELTLASADTDKYDSLLAAVSSNGREDEAAEVSVIVLSAMGTSMIMPAFTTAE